MRCMTSLPGESASSWREVTTPYATAPIAQTSATSTPWSVRKELKGRLSSELMERLPPCEERGERKRDGRRGRPTTPSTCPRARGILPRTPVEAPAGRLRRQREDVAYWPGTHRRPERCASPGPEPGWAGGPCGPSSPGPGGGPPAICAYASCSC